jgi:hypothetical protein
MVVRVRECMGEGDEKSYRKNGRTWTIIVYIYFPSSYSVRLRLKLERG